MPSCRVGIKDEEWHIDVIKHALKETSFYLKKETLTATGGSLLLIEADGLYMVDGHLNRAYMHKTKGKILHDGGEARNTDEAWRHAIAIKNKKIHCLGVGSNGLSVDHLWLDAMGTVDVVVFLQYTRSHVFPFPCM